MPDLAEELCHRAAVSVKLPKYIRSPLSSPQLMHSKSGRYVLLESSPSSPQGAKSRTMIAWHDILH